MRKSVPNGWNFFRKQGVKEGDLEFKCLYILIRIMSKVEDDLAMLFCYYMPACKEEKECA